MSLAHALAPFVSAGVRQRGQEYFRRRRVALGDCGPLGANALVDGTEVYAVGLARRASRVLGTCSCPFAADRGRPCKHMWATVLAVDAQGGLRGGDGSLPRRLVLATEADAAEAAEEPPASPRQRQSVWRAMVAKTAPSPVPPPAVGEIVYVVDAAATLQSNRLTIEVLTAARKADGTAAGWRPPQVNPAQLGQLPDPVDARLLALLTGVTTSGGWVSPYIDIPTRFALQEPASLTVVPLLCATGRCRLRRAAGAPLEPVVWDDGAPWEFGLEVRKERGGELAVTGALRRGEERIDLAEPVVMLQGGLLFREAVAGRHSAAESFGWVTLLRGSGTMPVPANEAADLLEHLLSAPGTPPLFRLPEALQVEEVRVEPRPRLRLRKPDRWQSYQGSPRADLILLYGDREVSATTPGRGLYEPARRRFLLRDREAEGRANERLLELGFRPVDDGLRIGASRVPAIVRTLVGEGWMVEAENKLYRPAGEHRAAVTSGMDWFELHGSVEFEGETVELPRLLAALRRGDGYVPLSDGSLGLLPEEWLSRLAAVARLGRAEGDHVRFQAAQAAFLDALLASEPGATCDETFAEARRRLQSFAGVAPEDPPPGFRGELRGYQRAGLGWLHFLRDFGLGGCLADDMGLGKTVQVLALLESRRALRAEAEEAPATSRRRSAKPPVPPSLAVVPRSLLFNWRAEATRFTPDLRILDYTGPDRPRDGKSFQGYDLVLTTYGTLRRDVRLLRQVEFDYIVLDEAQAIKNAASQTAKSARLLRGRHRLALSGTPVENHLGELWSLLEFLNPGLTGSHAFSAGGARDRQLFARALRPFLLRRTKEQVAPELPEKTEQTLFCELEPRQRRLYDELRDHYRAALGARLGENGLGRSKILVLEALLRLRQAACHPGLLDDHRGDDPSAKLELLLPRLRELVAEGHKALVFSQFTSFLALLRRHLDREGVPYEYLDGGTTDRQGRVARFQSDAGVPLFLISLKAGGVGLNLTAADYVFLLDPWWNPAVEAQAVDRSHRIGQTRPVIACRIVARDTVEERILELQAGKRELADAILETDGSLLANLSREDLELLLS